MSKQSKATRFIVFTGVFSAIAAVLSFFEFLIIPGNAYLKIDLGDLPAVIAGVALGPVTAAAVELIKVIIHAIGTGGGGTMGFGDLINFIVGVALTVPFSAVFRALMKKERGRIFSVLIAGITGLVCMAAAGVVGNYLIAPPYFEFVLHFKLTGAALWAAIGSATVLNVIKSVLLTVVMLPVLTAGKSFFKTNKTLI